MTISERIICGLVLLKDYETHTYGKDGNLCVDVFIDLDDDTHNMLLKMGWTYFDNWEGNSKIMYSYAL